MPHNPDQSWSPNWTTISLADVPRRVLDDPQFRGKLVVVCWLCGHVLRDEPRNDIPSTQDPAKTAAVGLWEEPDSCRECAEARDTWSHAQWEFLLRVIAWREDVIEETRDHYRNSVIAKLEAALTEVRVKLGLDPVRGTDWETIMEERDNRVLDP